MEAVRLLEVSKVCLVRVCLIFSLLLTWTHVDASTAYWSQETSEEGGESYPALCEQSLSSGLRCRGRYCDNVSLQCQASRSELGSSRWLGYISDGDHNEARCQGDELVTGLRCRGRYCDDISLRCTKTNTRRERCFWSPAVSEENTGMAQFGDGAYIAGMRCSGDYCDNKQVYVCVEKPASCNDRACQQDLAERFAPILRFDQKQGESEKCFPSDAGSYFAARKSGDRSRICNTDRNSLTDGSIPIYYQIQRCSESTTTIMYWFFYGYQDTCSPGLGAHDADWERVAVKLIDGRLDRVLYYQHGGSYTRLTGGFELHDETHPVVYVGKNSHGSYHDDGGSGSCLYFEDYRNPGGVDLKLATNQNLVRLEATSDSPEWMRYMGNELWDGISAPLSRGHDLCALPGCRGKDVKIGSALCFGQCGCSKSDIGDQPF